MILKYDACIENRRTGGFQCMYFSSIHTRIADDRFRSPRAVSMSSIIDAMLRLDAAAIWRSASTNSRSSEMLVLWPDKDTDIFCIFKISPQPGSRPMRGMDRHSTAMSPTSGCPTYSICRTRQMQTKTGRCVRILFCRKYWRCRRPRRSR